MKENKVNKVVHEWCEKNERWIHIEYNDNKIIGLNFMQGDEYECFKEKWGYNDEALMAFYTAMIDTFPIETSSCNQIEFINKVMWAFHEAGGSYEEFK